MQQRNTWSWAVLLLVIGVITRWLPHPPNFSSTIAIALFAGVVLPRPLALMIPVFSLFLGDLFLGFHDLIWVVYLSLLPVVAMGVTLPRANRTVMAKLLAWGLAGLTASTFFFITTNLAVWWWGANMYPHTMEGLVSCFVLAIPFFHNSLLATWIYLVGFALARRLISANYGRRRQTSTIY